MRKMKSELSKYLDYFKDSYISTRFLLIIAFLSFLIMVLSAFIKSDGAFIYISSIRSVFSSIVGFLLENTTRKIPCTSENLLLRNFIIGLLSILIIIFLVLCAIFDLDYTNPTINLLKNILLSCIGFLIGSSKNCN